MLEIPLAIAGIILGAILWRLGGNGYKWCRTFALPIVLALIKLVMCNFNLISLLYAPALMALLALFSYGISALPHKFWVWVFGGKGDDGNYPPVEICTRATCGFFWSLAAIAFLYCGGGLPNMIAYTGFLMVTNAIWGLVKNVWISECGAGGCVATSLLV